MLRNRHQPLEFPGHRENFDLAKKIIRSEAPITIYYSNNHTTSPLPNGVAPNAAVDEVGSVQDSDRRFDCIFVAFELALDLFCDGLHVWFPYSPI